MAASWRWATGTIITSNDGATWTAVPSPTSAHLYAVASDGRRWVAVGSAGTVITSDDGLHWTLEPPISPEDLRAVAFMNGQWLVGGDLGVWFTSQDGLRWLAQPTIAFSLRAFAQGNGIQVVTGAGIIASRQPGGPWIPNEAGFFHFKKGLAFGEGLFTVAGNVCGLQTSSDGMTWTSQTCPTNENLTALAYAHGLWVTTALGFLATSPNAMTWTPQTIPTQSTMRGIAYGAGHWVAVGDFGVILRSQDGISWQEVPAP
jgi:photosystem II stability/assembly factor-like uncharacterized protein